MLANRLRKNQRKLKAWLRREGVSCYRVYERDIPEIPLAIDRYGDHLHVAEFVTRRREEGPEGDAWIAGLAAAAGDALGIPADRVHLKQRRRQKGQAQYEKLGAGSERFVVEEGGHRFLVNLDDYLDTGLFLDHRTTRRLVADESRDKRVLNLFAYTGSFTVYAAAAGAASTTTVDMSNAYLAWASANLAENGLSDPTRHGFIRADVLAWLADPRTRQQRWDLVVVDPPTWSTSKKMVGTLDLQRDHVALLASVRDVLAPGGVLWFSTNNRRFQLDEAAFAGMTFEEVSDRTRPPDFRDARIHRCWRAQSAGG